MAYLNLLCVGLSGFAAGISFLSGSNWWLTYDLLAVTLNAIVVAHYIKLDI